MFEGKSKKIYNILAKDDIPDYIINIHTISPEGKINTEYLNIYDDVSISLNKGDVVIIHCGSNKTILNPNSTIFDIRGILKSYRESYIDSLGNEFSCSGVRMGISFIGTQEFVLGVKGTDVIINRTLLQRENLKLEVESRNVLTLPPEEHPIVKKDKKEITVEDIGGVLKKMGFYYVGSRTFIQSQKNTGCLIKIILPSDKEITNFFTKETSSCAEDDFDTEENICWFLFMSRGRFMR